MESKSAIIILTTCHSEDVDEKPSPRLNRDIYTFPDPLLKPSPTPLLSPCLYFSSLQFKFFKEKVSIFKGSK